MTAFGDPRAGFEIEVDLRRRRLHVRAWGLWPLELARQYHEAMLGAFRKLRGAPWSILSDRSRAVAQRPEVQQLITEVMQQATAAGRVRAAVVVDDAVLGLQMRRLARDLGFRQEVFADVASALAWIEADSAASGTS